MDNKYFDIKNLLESKMYDLISGFESKSGYLIDSDLNNVKNIIIEFTLLSEDIFLDILNNKDDKNLKKIFVDIIDNKDDLVSRLMYDYYKGNYSDYINFFTNIIKNDCSNFISIDNSCIELYKYFIKYNLLQSKDIAQVEEMEDLLKGVESEYYKDYRYLELMSDLYYKKYKMSNDRDMKENKEISKFNLIKSNNFLLNNINCILEKEEATDEELNLVEKYRKDLEKINTKLYIRYNTEEEEIITTN